MIPSVRYSNTGVPMLAYCSCVLAYTSSDASTCEYTISVVRRFKDQAPLCGECPCVVIECPVPPVWRSSAPCVASAPVWRVPLCGDRVSPVWRVPLCGDRVSPVWRSSVPCVASAPVWRVPLCGDRVPLCGECSCVAIECPLCGECPCVASAPVWRSSVPCVAIECPLCGECPCVAIECPLPFC